jgi:hypothetical protein
MKWKIQINGDNKYLEDLSALFHTLNFDPKISKEGENYYLEGDIFASTNSAKEISETANSFLTLLFHLPHFKTDRGINSPRIKNIIETLTTEEGKRVRTYDPDGESYSEELTTKDGKKNYTLHVNNITMKTSVQSVNLYSPESLKDFEQFRTIEMVNSLIENIKDNKELLEKLSEYLFSYLENLLKFSTSLNLPEDEKRKSKILSFLSNLELLNSESSIETLKWVFSYKIYEAIWKGFEEKEEKPKQWVGEDKIKRFKCTADLHRHAESENCKNLISNLGEMPLSEAKELISTLLSKYIEEKVKGGEP